MNKIFFVVLAPLLINCTPPVDEKAQEIVNKSIEAHGAQGFMTRDVRFVFRDIEYTTRRNKGGYTYIRSFSDSTGLVRDQLINSANFTRTLNGSPVVVVDSMVTRYTNSINSVLYFVQLPFLLNDAAVVKEYLGTNSLKGERYHQVRVTFKPEGGGVDFDDEYLYWFHTVDFTMDYLAYRYHTEGGGVRFREAYNRVERSGIVFQDYVNYEVPLGTSLRDIPSMFEAGRLRELSRIVNENVSVSDLTP